MQTWGSFSPMPAKAGRQQLFSRKFQTSLAHQAEKHDVRPQIPPLDEVGDCSPQIGGRYQTRDSLLILLLWRHGLQVSESNSALVNVTGTPPHQAKRTPFHQPIDGRELRLLRALKRESDGQLWIFMSGGEHLSMTIRCGKSSNLAGRSRVWFYPLHAPPCLRLPCHKGTDTIQDYLGRRTSSTPC